MKKGFTLVELSIVLVIIGLLIGGILVAQSLIDSTKIQSFVRTVQQYESSIHLFNDRYRGLPGDSPKITPSGTGTHLGDGDYALSAASALTFDEEAANFWPALQIGVGLDKDPTYIMDATSGIRHGQNSGNHIPEVDLGIGGGLLPTPNVFSSTTWGFWVANLNDTTNQVFGAGGSGGDFVDPATVLSIDTKIDNGLANSGVVQAGNTGVSGECALNATPTVYEVSVSDDICSIAISMFTTLEN